MNQHNQIIKEHVNVVNKINYENTMENNGKGGREINKLKRTSTIHKRQKRVGRLERKIMTKFTDGWMNRCT